MSDTAVVFTVIGEAVPKGSMRAYTIRRKDGGAGVRMTPGNERSVNAWSALVASAAQAQCVGEYFEGPLRLGAVFFFTHPKSGPRRKHHMVKPDIDKLLRCIADALTGVLWKDDAQIVELLGRKGYVYAGQPYARIIVDHAAPVEEVAVQTDLFAPLLELPS